MDEWFLSVDGKQYGPLDSVQAKSFVKENPGAWSWQKGMSDWLLAFQVPELWHYKKDGMPFPPPPPHFLSPKPANFPQNVSFAKEEPIVGVASMSSSSYGGASASSASVATTTSVVPSATPASSQVSSQFGHQGATVGLDYCIMGHEMQFVEIELDEGESVIAEAGAMMYKSASIEMATIFGGDGSSQQGIFGRLLAAGQRVLTGESLFLTVFTQKSHGKGRVAFAAPYPGTILPLCLRDYQGMIVCQKDSFLAGSRGVQISVHFQRRILTGLFGQEGFIMQALKGDGWVFIHTGGAIREIDLLPGEVFHVDTGCLVALTSTVDYNVTNVSGIKTAFFGGEGLFMAELRGPGKVWVQSLPFSRLVGRILTTCPNKHGD